MHPSRLHPTSDRQCPHRVAQWMVHHLRTRQHSEPHAFVGLHHSCSSKRSNQNSSNGTQRCHPHRAAALCFLMDAHTPLPRMCGCAQVGDPDIEMLHACIPPCAAASLDDSLGDLVLHHRPDEQQIAHRGPTAKPTSRLQAPADSRFRVPSCAF